MMKNDNTFEFSPFTIGSVLGLLGFTASGNILSKNYESGVSIAVDLSKQSIEYPASIKVNDLTTSNFSHNENFVVLECVNRLLEKGYSPSNIELEPKWSLGRDQKSGKADILVKDNDGNEYLIIECKNGFAEFESSWKKMLVDGDQLFSYAQQIKKTKILCLYYSDVVDGKVTYHNKIISLVDNDEYLKTLKENKVQRYSASTDVKSLFSVWRDIYNFEYDATGIFENEFKTYDNKKRAFRVSNLRKLTADESQRKYNEFATILRQHNISSHENAFDKLVNLFLAKIVDEIEHPNDLQFNWRGSSYDDYYSLQDRLQKLYKDGMQKFLNEEVTYVDNKQIDDAFRFVKNDPDSTKEKVLGFFRELKFYTNNDFAFIDVHNQQLFVQNSEILLKMVKLFQEIQLKTPERNQFLGDLFEGFLDQGVRQNEGQFFTPLPIVRFIVSALPVSKEIENTGIPKVIDYACGAGHFLNEYAAQLGKFVLKDQLPSFYKQIFGVEKEYRLSKVSKVSAFMYGQDGIDITYGDALAHHDKLLDGSFDILIANPPYSVKGFLETLDSDDVEKYELSSEVKKGSYSANKSIEAFFVERAKQLLKDGGVAGIILPSPILSNGGALYAKTREILISYFDIIAISEFGSDTFGATGTNTITLFLRRKEDADQTIRQFTERVNSWFRGEFGKDQIYGDAFYLQNYLASQGIDINDYKEFINGNITSGIKGTTLFKKYLQKFPIKKIQEIEKHKLLMYILASQQGNPVFVARCPSNSKEMKKYLGYEWSKRKGSEGIKYLGSSIGDNDFRKNRGIETISTPLFNPADDNDETKINDIIRDNFEGIIHDSIPANCSYYRFTQLMDFTQTKFDSNIKLSINQDIKVKSKYPVEPLVEVCDVNIGGTPSREVNSYFSGKNLWVSIGEMNGQVITDTNEKITDEAVKKSNVKLIPAGTTLLSFKLSIGKTAVAGADLYTNEAIAGLLPKDKEKVLDKYLFYLFTSGYLNASDIGKKAFGTSLNSDFLKNHVFIPVPPKAVQEKLISDCEKLDGVFEKTRMTISDYKGKIHALLIQGGVFQ